MVRWVVGSILHGGPIELFLVPASVISVLCSSIDHLVRVETFLQDSFDHNQHLDSVCMGVFFHFEKAYDMIWKYVIMKDFHGFSLRREGIVLFNDALNTFYLRLYGVRHMVKDHSDSEKGNPLPPDMLLLSINSKGSFICTIPQRG